MREVRVVVGRVANLAIFLPLVAHQRQSACERNARYPRQGGEARLQRFDEAFARGVIGITGCEKSDAARQYAINGDAKWRFLCRDGAANGDTGSDQQDHAQGDFAGNQYARKFAALADTATLTKYALHIDASGPQRWQQAGCECRQQGDPAREQDIAQVGRAIQPVRHLSGRVLHDAIHHVARDGGAEPTQCRRKHGNYDGFGQHLHDQSASAGTKCRAHGQLTRARREPRHHQAGDIRASNQQHQQDRNKHRPTGFTNLRLDEFIGERLDLGSVASERLAALARQYFDHSREVRFRLGEGFAITQATKGLHILRCVAGCERTVRGEGHPDRLGDRKCEARGHHTDDGRRLAIDTHLPAHHVRVGIELQLPHALADQGNWRCAFLRVFRREAASQAWPCAKCGKRVVAYPGARQPLRWPLNAADAHRPNRIRLQRAHGLLAIAKIQPVDQGHRKITTTGFAVGVLDTDQLIGVGKRQRLERVDVDGAEHEDRQADTDAQHQHGSTGEHGAARKRTQGETQVVDHREALFIAQRNHRVETCCPPGRQ